VAVNCCVVPGASEGFAGVTAIEVNPTAVPVPSRVAVCGLPPALSMTVRVPELLPAAEGVKVTLITQFPLGGRDAGHALAANDPEAETLEMLMGVD